MPLTPLKPRKGSLGLYITLLLLAVAAMAAIKQCSSGRIGPRPEFRTAAGDTLNVAIEISPVSVTLSGDTLAGPFYDKIRAISARIGRPVKFHPFTRLSDALQWLREGRCRLVAGDIPITAELREKYIFVDPGDVNRLVLVQLRDSAGALEVATQTDLGKRTVWVPDGSPALMRLHNLGREIGDTIFVREDPEYGAEELGMLVALGELPGGLTVVSRPVADTLLRHYPQLDASVEVSFNQYRGWAMLPADSLLRDSLASALLHP